MRTFFASIDCPSLSRPVTAKELTLADIRALMGARTSGTDEAGAARLALGVLFDLAPEDSGRLTEAETARLMAASARLNPDFLSGASGAEDDAHTAGGNAAANVAALEKAVARMVAHGHANAWDYPWQVFRRAVEVLEEDAERET